MDSTLGRPTNGNKWSFPPTNPRLPIDMLPMDRTSSVHRIECSRRSIQSSRFDPRGSRSMDRLSFDVSLASAIHGELPKVARRREVIASGTRQSTRHLRRFLRFVRHSSREPLSSAFRSYLASPEISEDNL
jgi:hypothetical protein